MDKKHIEDIIDKEIIEKYSVETLNSVNDFPHSVRNYFKFAILRFDLNKDLALIKTKLLDPIKNNKIDMRSQKELIELINSYLGISEVERKTFGEVSTPIYNHTGSVDEQLNLLDKEFWSNPDAKILDPSCGVGNYEVVLVSNFMKGLKDWEPDTKKRYKHIMENIIYVVDINPKNLWIYYNIFDEENELNMNYYLGSFLEEGFDNHMKDVWKIDKFDLVCSNFPYQEMIDGNNRMKTLYNLFIEKSIKISNKIVSIHPSRWMAGGFGLDSFRKMMLKRKDIKQIIHFNDATEIFGNTVEIKGGIQYFLIDKKYNGLTEYNGVPCDLNKFDIFVEPKYYTLLEKIINKNNLKLICKSQSYYGFPGNETLFTKDKKPNSIKVYVSKNKGVEMFVDKNIVDNNKSKGYKVFTTAASGSNKKLGIFGNKIIGLPNEVCSKSYITLITNSELESKNLISYMNTKFCNFFLSLRKNTQNIKPDTLKWIPMIPLNKSWSDEELYEYFNLTQEEIDLIEKTIK